MAFSISVFKVFFSTRRCRHVVCAAWNVLGNLFCGSPFCCIFYICFRSGAMYHFMPYRIKYARAERHIPPPPSLSGFVGMPPPHVVVGRNLVAVPPGGE